MKSLLAIVCLLWAPVGLGAMRCGNQLVAEGDSKFDVLMRCGPPTFSEVPGQLATERYRLDRTETYARYIEVWHYDCGYGLLSKSLVFEGEDLRAIRPGHHRGSGPQRCW